MLCVAVIKVSTLGENFDSRDATAGHPFQNPWTKPLSDMYVG
jgi:hypothetical protein